MISLNRLNRLNSALRQENYLEHLGTQYFLLLMVIFSVCFLSLLQPVTAMPHHALTLSVYALNANGFISTAKIHHINNVIWLRWPHLFVILEMKCPQRCHLTSWHRNTMYMRKLVFTAQITTYASGVWLLAFRKIYKYHNIFHSLTPPSMVAL